MSFANNFLYNEKASFVAFFDLPPFLTANCSFLPDFIQKNLFKICLKNYLFVSISLFGFQWSFFADPLICWWAQVDSNHRPRAYQARALTCWAMSPFSYLRVSLPSFAYCEAFASGGDDGIRTHDPLLAGQVLSQLSYTPVFGLHSPWKLNNCLIPNLILLNLFESTRILPYPHVLHRKEVIQPHLLIRLPCYDLTPITSPTFDHVLLAVRLWASGVANFHGLTGGVYKARERIHRGMLIRDY